MHANIVDVTKAVSKWDERVPILEALLGPERVECLQALIRPRLARVVANEYFVHEAGHALGYDTERKYADGYFRVSGRTIWPLVYVEELRADLLSFAFAAELLNREEAAAVFLYNVFLRLGVHAEGVTGRQTKSPPYGMIPAMLYGLLRASGWISFEGAYATAPLRLSSLETAALVEVMLGCAAQARERLLGPEAMNRSSPTDAAIVAARYYRAALSDGLVDDELSNVCNIAGDRAGAGLSPRV